MELLKEDISTYTDFYLDISFMKNVKKVEDIEIKEIPLEYCNLHLIPLNQKTMKLYDSVREKKKVNWRIE